MMFDGYKHKVPVQLRFSDIDRLNHVNNALYHTYIELGRVHYLNEVLNRSVDWEQRGFILAHMEVDHLTPIFLTDEVFCFTKVSKVGTKSITLKNAVTKLVHSEWVLCADASSVLVAMDYQDNVTIPLPPEWRRLISSFDNI
ncbi:MAG: thioesterase family protein [bacterium]|nr:thioesterase family protein [bacterium]